MSTATFRLVHVVIMTGFRNLLETANHHREDGEHGGVFVLSVLSVVKHV